MPIDPSYFPLTKHLNIGDKVRCRFKNRTVWEEGVITTIWFGLEEAVTVQHADGRFRTFYLALGDEIEVVK